MSKIQDALKRIRDAKATQEASTRAVTPPSRRSAPVANVEDAEAAEPAFDETVARLVLRTPLTEGASEDVTEEPVYMGRALPERDAEHYVQVDRDKLRAAGLMAPETQSRLMADQYRLIKRPLLDNAVGKNAATVEDGNLIMISSALSGDGITFTCINLALSMASEKDMTILLVDADVAKPHISKIFGVSQQPGLILVA